MTGREAHDHIDLTEEKLCLAALQQTDGIGSKTIRRLIAAFGSAAAAWRAGSTELRRRGLLTVPQGKSLAESEKQISLPDLAKSLQQHGIGVIDFREECFPARLKEIYNPPAVLFYKGELSCLGRLDKPIAMVGARNCSPYGKNVARYFGEMLSNHGVTIVSGGAKGIDACSHEGALQGRTPTIAVMGCGLDRFYPQENRKLFFRIAEEGLLLSEYPPGTEPAAAHFPARNRIIAGMTRGVVVVEAKGRSGSLITADMAINEGRDVFAIPGNVLSPYNDGVHWLLRQGAGILTRPEDLLEEYGWLQAAGLAGEANAASLKKDSSHIGNSMISFTLEETRVVDILETDRIVSVEELVTSSGFSLTDVQLVLLELEMKKVVEKIGTEGYLLVKFGR